MFRLETQHLKRENVTFASFQILSTSGETINDVCVTLLISRVLIKMQTVYIFQIGEINRLSDFPLSLEARKSFTIRDKPFFRFFLKYKNLK